MTTLATLLAERYAEPAWFAKPVDPPEDQVTCRRRLTACVAEAEAPQDGRGRWVTRRGIKVWRAA